MTLNCWTSCWWMWICFSLTSFQGIQQFLTFSFFYLLYSKVYILFLYLERLLCFLIPYTCRANRRFADGSHDEKTLYQLSHPVSWQSVAVGANFPYLAQYLPHYPSENGLLKKINALISSGLYGSDAEKRLVHDLLNPIRHKPTVRPVRHAGQNVKVSLRLRLYQLIEIVSESQGVRKFYIFQKHN